jgi:hypothetical protein
MDLCLLKHKYALSVQLTLEATVQLHKGSRKTLKQQQVGGCDSLTTHTALK